MYNAPIKAKYPQKTQVPQQPSMGIGFGEISILIYQLQGLKNDLIGTVNQKIKEIDEKIKGHIDDLVNANQTIKNTQSQVIDHVGKIKKGEPGKDADEEAIQKRLEAKFPKIDTEKLTQEILAKVPKVKPTDEEALTQRILKALPKNKASLKIIQESFEVDPMSVIEKIMALPKGKFKLKTEHIDGLEQTMNAFRSQLGRGYLHGGGTTVAAGTNITLVKNANGTTTINASGGGGFIILNTASTVDGSNQTFVFSTATAQPTFIVSDGVYFTALDNNGNTQWSWNSGTKTVTLTVPPPINSIFAIQ